MRQEHDLGGSFALGPQRVHRTGYGAMQLAGDGGLQAACARISPCPFASSQPTCALTVDMLTNSLAAISSFDRPSSISVSTSRSRSVISASAAGGCYSARACW